MPVVGAWSAPTLLVTEGQKQREETVPNACGSRRHVPATGEALRRLAARARPASVMPCFALLPARRRHRLETVTRGQDEWRPCRFPPPRSCNPRSHQCGTAFSLGPPFSVTVPSELRNTPKADFHGAAF